MKPWLRPGDPHPPLPGSKRRPLADRLMRLTMEMPNGCWEWTGYKTGGGYGMIRDGKMRATHVVAYELTYGPVPDGLEVHHTCFNEACDRPDHLEAVTHQRNCLETALAGRHHGQAKTECPKKHPYDEQNTGTDHRGHRVCRTCKRDDARRRRAAA